MLLISIQYADNTGMLFDTMNYYSYDFTKWFFKYLFPRKFFDN